MPRTIGAKNKPKVVNIELSQLISMFKTDMRIPVDINFAKAMQLTVAEVPNLCEDNSDSEPMTPPKVEVY